ncbi:unnamed protein product [Cyprideis torosa]|uniref:Uncharacterized protein n=1 Tax=Cyprideis torosa TaxID=163714 RepID=A0A7R8WYU8_9CRUS|nr:unnamed protein product [Cyprideis torosa]CAG0909904.1 unnamed protein product [Cyprideis torosa]
MINREKLDRILAEKVKLDELDEAIICGPEPMMIGVANGLYQNGMDKSKIKFELFAPPSQPLFEEVAEVAKQEPEVEKAGSISVGDSYKIKITLDDEVIEKELVKTDGTLIDQLIDADIDAPYSCKGGVCSSCIAKVTVGEVEFNTAKNFVLTDEEMDNGFVLCCQSKPKSAYIEIDFDDAP